MRSKLLLVAVGSRRAGGMGKGKGEGERADIDKRHNDQNYFLPRDATFSLDIVERLTQGREFGSGVLLRTI